MSYLQSIRLTFPTLFGEWESQKPKYEQVDYPPREIYKAAGGDADVAANQLLAERLIEWKKVFINGGKSGEVVFLLFYISYRL